jgi:hypothetical protein
MFSDFIIFLSLKSEENFIKTFLRKYLILLKDIFQRNSIKESFYFE